MGSFQIINQIFKLPQVSHYMDRSPYPLLNGWRWDGGAQGAKLPPPPFGFCEPDEKLRSSLQTHEFYHQNVLCPGNTGRVVGIHLEYT